MKNFKVIELTKENEVLYLEQVANLEKIVLENMIKAGKKGQLFITGKDDISDYVHSKENTVMIAIDECDIVQSATYITQGQIPYTYNDITKYFKVGKGYQKYVRDTYKSEYEYKSDMLEMYKIKLEAFKKAKNTILKQHPEFGEDIIAYLKHELSDTENQFHEKSELRENINKYMSQYIAQELGLEKKYEKFYWITADDIKKEFQKGIDINRNPDILELETFMNQEQEEYKEIMKKGNLCIFDKSQFDEEKYYEANTKNSIEIDTYITHPSQRNSGVARALVYEGIRKHIQNHFSDPNNKEIYLCSTLHRDNLSSKYVSEFFGLKDSIYVQRRQGRNREVHICKIERENIPEYLENVQDKLIVLYGYNPSNKRLSPSRKVEVLNEQVQYEKDELLRLNSFKSSDKKYKGKNLNEITSKIHKIKQLKQQIEECEQNSNKGENDDREI